MSRRHFIAGLGALTILAIGAWVGREWLGERYWRWQASGTQAVTLDACEDPGAALLFRAIVQDAAMPCEPGEWLPWLEEDLEHTGARRWVNAHRNSPLSTPLQRFRMGLAISRTSDLRVPELAALLGDEAVSADERAWTRRWLAHGQSMPAWVDPVVEHGVAVQRFVDGELSAQEWLLLLEQSRVGPGAVPSDLRDEAVIRTVDLLRSADPEQDTPLDCQTPDDACYGALIEAVDRVVLADSRGFDGGAAEVARGSSRPEPTLATGYFRALYGVDDARVEAADGWIHAIATGEAEPTDSWWLTPNAVNDAVAGATNPAAVLGARGGTPWATALAGAAVARLRGQDLGIVELSEVAVRFDALGASASACGGSAAMEATGTPLTDVQVVARAAAEAASLAVLDVQMESARRLAGLAERSDPERFAGFAASLGEVDTGTAASALGRRIGRLSDPDATIAAWWTARRAEGADACQAWLPPQAADQPG